MIQDVGTGVGMNPDTAIWVAAIGGVVSVILAWINNGIARKTQHTVNSKTTALENEIQALKTAIATAGILNAQKDVTIAAQMAPSPVQQRPPASMDVTIIGQEQPVEVVAATKKP